MSDLARIAQGRVPMRRVDRIVKKVGAMRNRNADQVAVRRGLTKETDQAAWSGGDRFNSAFATHWGHLSAAAKPRP